MKRFCKWCLKVKIHDHRDRQCRNIYGVRLCRGAERSGPFCLNDNNLRKWIFMCWIAVITLLLLPVNIVLLWNYIDKLRHCC